MAGTNPIKISDVPQELRPLLEIADNTEGSDAEVGVIRSDKEAGFASNLACSFQMITEENIRPEHANRCFQMLRLFRDQGGYPETAKSLLRKIPAYSVQGKTEEIPEILKAAAKLAQSDEEWEVIFEVYVQLGKVEEAAAIVPNVQSPSHQAVMSLGVVAHRNQFSQEEFERELENLMKRFPLDPELRVIVTDLLVKKGRFNEALASAQEGTKTIPNNPDLWEQLALAYIQNGEKDKGTQALNKALELDPKHLHALTMKIELLRTPPIDNKALQEALSEGLRHHPYKAQWLAMRSQIFYEEKLPRHALADALQSVHLDPWQSALFGIQGAAFYKIGQVQKAIEATDQAITFNPDNFAYYVIKGWYWKELNNFKEMQQSFRTGLSRKGDKPKELLVKAHRGLAHAAYKLGQWEEAKKEVALLLDLEPNNAHGLAILGSVHLETGDLDKAKVYLERAKTLSPTEAAVDEFYVKLLQKLGKNKEAQELTAKLEEYYGWKYLKDNELEQALQSFRNSLLANDVNHRSWTGLGLVFIELNQTQNAKEAFERGLKSLAQSGKEEKGMPLLYGGYGEILGKEGKNKEAVKFFQKGLALEPSFFRLNEGLISTFLSMREVDRALEQANTYLQLPNQEAGEKADAYILRANVHRMAGRLQEAEQDEEMALKLDPTNTQALEKYALKLAMEDNFEKSLEVIERAMSFDPSNWRTQTTLGRILCAMGRVQEGISVLEKAMRPGNFPGKETLATAYYLQGLMERAIFQLEDLKRAAYRSFEIDDLMHAMALLHLGRYKEALPILESLRKGNAPADHIQYVQFFYYFALADVQGDAAALAELRKILPQFPQSGSLHGLEGELLSRLGKEEEADASFRRATTIEPKNIDVRHMLAWRAAKQQKYDEALRHLAAIVPMIPKLQRELKLLEAWIYYKQKRFDKGIELLKPLVAEDQIPSPDTLSLMAAFQWEKNQRETALQLVQRAKDLGLPSPYILPIARNTVNALLQIEESQQATEDGVEGESQTPPWLTDFAKQLDEEAKKNQQKTGDPSRFSPIPLGPLDFHWFNAPTRREKKE